MWIEITQAGNYSKFTGGKSAAQELEVGAVVDLPAWYAESLIESDLAKAVPKEKTTGTRVFEQDLDDPAPLPEQAKRSVKRGKRKKPVRK